MKINIEFDITPEEFRTAMGLPDLTGLHQSVLDQLSESLKSSAEQRDAFAQTLLAGAMEPWQALAKFVSGNSTKP